MLTALLVALLPPVVTQVGEYLRARAARAYDERLTALEARIVKLEERTKEQL